MNFDSYRDSTDDRQLCGRDKGRTARIGIVLILLSGLLWFSLFAIPFLSLTVGQKAALAGAVFVGVQIAWWSGAALVGPQTVARLRPWWGSRKGTDEPSESHRDQHIEPHHVATPSAAVRSQLEQDSQ